MKAFMKIVIFSGILIGCLWIIQCKYASAKYDYTGISDLEREIISEYIQTDEMINTLSFALSETVTKDDINFCDCYKVNMLSTDFYNKWSSNASAESIYSDMWQYKIPLIIKDKKTVITLKNNDDRFVFCGVSYGEGNVIYFIDVQNIEKNIQNIGLTENEINYSDVLFASLVNTLFIHINSMGKDYLIPYTAVDLSAYSEYTDKMYISGEIYEISEVIELIANSSYAPKSNINNYEVDKLELLGGGGLNFDGIDLKDNEKNIVDLKADSLTVTGLIMVASLLLLVVVVKKIKSL